MHTSPVALSDAVVVSAALLIALTVEYLPREIRSLRFDLWNAFLVCAGFALVGLALALGLWTIIRLVRRYGRRGGGTEVGFGPDTILFLRSFADDRAVVAHKGYFARLFLRKLRLEEVNARYLEVVGKFVAVGTPGERLPPLGAQRVYLEHEEWKDYVLAGIRQSGMIVMIAGMTPWVRWELSQIIEAGAIHKLLLLVAPGDDAIIGARWRKLVEAIDDAGLRKNLGQIDPIDVLAVTIPVSGGPVVLRSDDRNELDYELAALWASRHLMAHA